MSSLLHACLYNAEADSSGQLTSHICDLNFVRLTAEATCPEQLAEVLGSGGMNVVFFHMDPNPDDVVAIIEQVATRFPELALIAISHQTGPQAILGPMRAGCDQFVCEPIDPADLSNAVARVASKRFATETKSHCVCVIGSSGGAGTTTIACNLALEIGKVTDRVCALVDLDLQFGDVALNFDCEPKYSIFDIADSGSAVDKTVLDSTMYKLPCKVSLLSRPERIEQCETVSPELVHEMLERMTDAFEHVVVDLPKHVDSRSIAALARADLIVIVSQLLVPSMRNAKRLLDMLRRLGVPDERIEFVVNRADGRSGRLSVKDLEESVGKQVLAAVPNDFEFVARSIDVGKPIAALDRNSPVRSAIRQIAGKILGANQGPTEAEPQNSQSFLGRLFSK